MRILFENEVVLSTVTALYANPNYPVANINHVFLKKIYKSTQNTDVVTTVFSADKNINSIYVGLTNAVSITARLYNVSNTLLSTKVIDMDKLSDVFASIPLVRYITFTFTAVTQVYVGTIATGLNYTLPDPLSDVIKGYKDNSIMTESLDGQATINKIQVLKKVKSSHFVKTIDDYNSIYLLFANVDRPVWIDYFEGTTNALNPIYGNVKLENMAKEGILYTFDIITNEVR